MGRHPASGTSATSLFKVLALSALLHLGALVLLWAWPPGGGDRLVRSGSSGTSPALLLLLSKPLIAPADRSDDDVRPVAVQRLASDVAAMGDRRSATGLLMGGATYYSPEELDGPLVPVSAPDTSRLEHVVFSGLPIHLRLWIDEGGQVRSVEILQAAVADQAAVDQIRAMFLDTAYIPGLRQGRPVAVRLELQLDFGLPVLSRVAQQTGG